jgi:hypothetical protein
VPFLRAACCIDAKARVELLDGGEQHYEERQQIVVVLVEHEPRERQLGVRRPQRRNGGGLPRPGGRRYQRQPLADRSLVDAFKQPWALQEISADMRWVEFGVRAPNRKCERFLHKAVGLGRVRA